MNNNMWLFLLLFSFCVTGQSEVTAFEQKHKMSSLRDPFVKGEEREIDLQPITDTEKSESLPVLSQEMIKVKYAVAENVAQLLDRDSRHSLLSEYGSLSFDERTNSLIIKDKPETLAILKEVINQIDIPVKQVQIESRIAIINQGNIEELGVRWGVNSRSKHLTVGGTIDGNYQELLNGDEETNLEDFLNISLGSGSPNASSIAFQIATLGSSALLDLELSALQAESKAEVISSPSLLTTNKKPAYIEQGTEIPYLEATENGAATVKFRKAVLSLEVTPQITPDNTLILDLLVTQDRPGQIVKMGNGETVAIDTQRIATQVLVKDGETVVLGGIFQHTMIRSVDKVPLLSSIPLVGGLFRRSYDNQEKRELLIFVTPKVLEH